MDVDKQIRSLKDIAKRLAELNARGGLPLELQDIVRELMRSVNDHIKELEGTSRPK